MTGNRKTVGLLATVAVLALSMTAVSSSAGAEKFTASAYPATLHGSSTVAHAYTFSGGRKYECKTTTHTGQLSEPSEKVKLIPKNSECSFFIGGSPFTATTSGSCEGELDHYNFWFFWTRTICTKNYKHNVSVYSGESLICEYSLSETDGTEGGQENLGGTKGIEISWEIGGLSYTRTFGSLLVCGPAMGTYGYTGTSVITAKNGGGEAIEFHIG